MKFFLNFVLLFCATSIYCQSTGETAYFRHLRYNHVSPYIEISGIHPINKSTAQNTSHYIFKHDSSGRLIEVINNHYHTEKRHPLASLGVYKLAVEYKNDQEIRTFYDMNGRRISNDREVYKEVYSYNSRNMSKTKLQFFDLDNNPMESNWKIAEYHWKKKDMLVIERRFNLKNEMVNVSPYFEFGITGILLNNDGSPAEHYNLNEQLEVTNNPIGVASYRDNYDNQGNHIDYRYYNAEEDLVLNQWKFAVGRKKYDALGNNIHLDQYDPNGEVVRSRPIYSNAAIELSPSASAQDSADIKRQSLGYLVALQQLDTALMNEVMNDSLNKVTIGYNRDIKKEVSKPTTRDQMIAFAEDWNKSNMKFPFNPTNQVTILSIYNRIASVKLVSDNWVEYLHLIKLNGKWDIVNLIWQHKDVNRYPK